MENIWDVYQYNLVRMNKHQSGRTITPEEFSLVAATINYTFFKVKVGLPETYRPGAPFAPQEWQVSQKITDDCSHLLVWMGGPDYPLMSIDKYGRANKPSDYFAFSSCYYDYVNQSGCDDQKSSFRSVEFILDAMWADRQQSVLKGPELKYPIAKWGSSFIQFLPKNLGFVHFTYLREPATPVLAYTIDGNNDIVYDPANSVQFDWPKTTLPDLANFIFEIMSQNIKSQQDIQLAIQRKMTGQ